MSSKQKDFRLRYGSLESRQLLATISLSGGELLIGGGTGDDVATVSVSGSNVNVVLTGVDPASFPAADVEVISFVGLAGDDRFTNNTSIPSFAYGLDGDDVLVGGSASDTLVGGRGNDTLTGNGGEDTIRGGLDGTKLIDGGDGNDRLFGGTETNEIRGGDGDDLIFGGPELDMIFGGAGNDNLFPGHGTNTVRAGAGNDLVISGTGSDTVFGDDGNDIAYTGDGDDTVEGGDGNDRLITGKGKDVLRGQGGSDYLRGGDGDDMLDGGDGVSDGMDGDLSFGLFGEDGNDTIVGGADADRINGGAGNDNIDSGGGNDIVFGDVGDDTIKLGAGDDFARGDDGDDRIEGQSGNDTMFGNGGDDELIGGSGRDATSFDFNSPRYRVAGSLFVRDMEGNDGTDDLSSMERIRFQNEVIDAESQVQEIITIQPIIVSNTNGSNTAEFFGTAEQEREIKTLINDIYYQARIQVNWATPNTWNNTFANVGNGGTRPFNDAFEIIDRGADAGVTSRSSLTLNMFFIEIVPGNGNLSENQTNGVSLDGENGVTFQVGDNLPTFADGRQAVANVAAHEIAHNLGLEHVSDPDNLLNFPNITGNELDTAQRNALLDSRFSRPV